MKPIKSMQELIRLAVSDSIPNNELECAFTMTDDFEGVDIDFEVHTARVAYRDVILYTDKGIITYMIDTYGDRPTMEAYDWDLD